MSLYICFHLHNIVSCSNVLEEFFVSQFYITFTSSNVPGYQYHVPDFLKPIFIHLHICTHTDVYIENCKHDTHEERHYHFSDTQWIRKSENYYSVQIYLYIQKNSIVSQKNCDDVLHVSCLKFSLFSLGLLCISSSYFKRDLQAILKNDSSVL